MSFLIPVLAPLLSKLVAPHAGGGATDAALQTAQSMFLDGQNADQIAQLTQARALNHKHNQFVAKMDVEAEEAKEGNLQQSFMLSVEDAHKKQIDKLLNQI